MTTADLIALAPLIILALFANANLVLIAFYRRHQVSFGLTLAGLALAFVALPWRAPPLPRQVTPLFIADHYALFFIGLLLAAAFVVTLLAYGYWKNERIHREEFYTLLLIATLGSAVLVTARHFITFFLGLETLTVSLYVLIAYLYLEERNIEAGVKYLILAAVASAFLLFGLALIYADLGTMELARVATVLAQPAGAPGQLLLIGLVLVIIGIGFKLAVVPFHLWTPDVYQGATLPATAFVATVSKGGMFAFVLRYFVQMDFVAYQPLFWILAFIAAASMLIGNLLALLQNNIKRILAYSSIANIGYLLVAVLAAGDLAVTAGAYYLTAYFVTILAAFGVVTALSSRRPAVVIHANGAEHHAEAQPQPENTPGEAETLDDYRGLFWRRPWLAALLTAALLSLAGIPLTAGFIGKFYLVTAGIEAARWWLTIVLVVSSAIGLFYYLRIIVMMALPARPVATPAPSLSLPGGIALVLLALALFWLGVYPTPFINLIRTTTGPLLESITQGPGL